MLLIVWYVNWVSVCVDRADAKRQSSCYSIFSFFFSFQQKKQSSSVKSDSSNRCAMYSDANQTGIAIDHCPNQKVKAKVNFEIERTCKLDCIDSNAEEFTGWEKERKRWALKSTNLVWIFVFLNLRKRKAISCN